MNYMAKVAILTTRKNVKGCRTQHFISFHLFVFPGRWRPSGPPLTRPIAGSVTVSEGAALVRAQSGAHGRKRGVVSHQLAQMPRSLDLAASVVGPRAGHRLGLGHRPPRPLEAAAAPAADLDLEGEFTHWLIDPKMFRLTSGSSIIHTPVEYLYTCSVVLLFHLVLTKPKIFHFLCVLAVVKPPGTTNLQAQPRLP